MSDNNNKKTLFILTISTLVAFVVLGAVTYAWFTNNTRVGTDTVSGKTGTASLSLLIGPDEGSMESTTTDGVEIGQVNDNTERTLYPVSTSDLSKFYYCPVFTNGRAEKFLEDTDEKRLYHGRVYMKLEGENIPEGQNYKLYLDTSEDRGGVFGSATDGYMLNAARLGISIEGSDPVIFKFTEDGKGDYEDNTVIGGTLLSDGYVLDSTTSATQDPSVDFEMYSLDSSAQTVELPENALATMELNTTYPVDIYFYLEGCDQDCVESLSLKECDMHLAFYAIAE